MTRHIFLTSTRNATAGRAQSGGGLVGFVQDPVEQGMISAPLNPKPLNLKPENP